MSFAPRWKDALLVGGPLLVLYGITMSRDLGVIDSGELATVATRLDIAHPTGYALYTCLGRLAVLAYPGAPILAVNWLSALCVAGAATVLTGGARGVLANLSRLHRKPPGRSAAIPQDPEVDRRVDSILAPAAGLLLGVSAVAWEQATGNEVYGLHLLFVSLLLSWIVAAAGGMDCNHRGLRSRRLSARISATHPRVLLGVAFLGGLAGANHLSIVFLFPVTIGLWLSAVWTLSKRVSFLGAALLLCLLGLSFNLFLPIRSVTEPLLDWGAPHEWDRFWKHYLADQYSVWHFQSWDSFRSNLVGYLGSLAHRFHWVALPFAVWGFVSLSRSGPRTAVALGVVFATTLVWASGYEIFDLEPYFLPADWTVAILVAIGWSCALRRVGLSGTERAGRWALPLVGVLVATTLFLQVGPRWHLRDRSDDRFIRTHLEISLESLPRGALVYSGFWDAFVSPSLYVQFVEGTRTDLAIVDPELMRRSWYFPQLRRMYPGLLEPVEAEVASFLEQLRLFEADLPYDPQQIEGRYRVLLARLAASDPDRPVASTPDVAPTYLNRTSESDPSRVAIPEGLMFRARDSVVGSAPLAPPDVDRLLAAGYRPEDRIHQQVLEQWSVAFQARVEYLMATGRGEEAPPWRDALTAIRRAAESG